MHSDQYGGKWYVGVGCGNKAVWRKGEGATILCGAFQISLLQLPKYIRMILLCFYMCVHVCSCVLFMHFIVAHVFIKSLARLMKLKPPIFF